MSVVNSSGAAAGHRICSQGAWSNDPCRGSEFGGPEHGTGFIRIQGKYGPGPAGDNPAGDKLGTRRVGLGQDTSTRDDYRRNGEQVMSKHSGSYPLIFSFERGYGSI